MLDLVSIRNTTNITLFDKLSCNLLAQDPVGSSNTGLGFNKSSKVLRLKSELLNERAKTTDTQTKQEKQQENMKRFMYILHLLH